MQGKEFKSDHAKRFQAHDILQVGFTFEFPWTDNKEDVRLFQIKFQI